jgi:hypothetical protein|tara:strand:- start:11763 stop:12278 length:516 start_codon:yes stop_codon:yes gene_type:complete
MTDFLEKPIDPPKDPRGEKMQARKGKEAPSCLACLGEGLLPAKEPSRGVRVGVFQVQNPVEGAWLEDDLGEKREARLGLGSPVFPNWRSTPKQHQKLRTSPKDSIVLLKMGNAPPFGKQTAQPREPNRGQVKAEAPKRAYPNFVPRKERKESRQKHPKPKEVWHLPEECEE